MVIDLDYCAGPHFLLEASGIAREKLADRAFITALFTSLSGQINGQSKSIQAVFDFESDPAESGLSASAVLGGLHLTIHTFPSRKQLQASVYSPFDIDAQLVQRELLSAFAPEKHEISFISQSLSSCVS